MKNTKGVMNVEVKRIPPTENEYVRIGCHKVDERVKEIVQFVRSRESILEVIRDGEQYTVSIGEIFYIESVDDKTFVYMEKDCYETRRKLYDLTEELKPNHFVRISKPIIVNLMKIVSIKPALNGRYLCKLKNGEEVIISRKYVPEIKKKLRGDES